MTQQPPHETKFQKKLHTLAKDTRLFISNMPRTIASLSDCRNLIHSTGAVAAEYSNAEGAPSTRSFISRLRTCRKHTRRAQLWIRLLDARLDPKSENRRKALLSTAYEIDRYLSTLIMETLKQQATKKKAQPHPDVPDDPDDPDVPDDPEAPDARQKPINLHDLPF